MNYILKIIMNYLKKIDNKKIKNILILENLNDENINKLLKKSIYYNKNITIFEEKKLINLDRYSYKIFIYLNENNSLINIKDRNGVFGYKINLLKYKKIFDKKEKLEKIEKLNEI